MDHGGAIVTPEATTLTLGDDIAGSDGALFVASAHLLGSDLAQALACPECHVVPAKLSDPGHIDGHTEPTFGALAQSNGHQPQFDARIKEPQPYRPAFGTLLELDAPAVLEDAHDAPLPIAFHLRLAPAACSGAM